MPKSGVPVTYHFSPENVAVGDAKSRFNSNIEAIKTLRKIEAENRFATSEEQAVMAKYVGWGGIQQAFVNDKVAENISGNLGEAAPSGWENEQKELLKLLSPEEYKAARASTLTSFYTPPDVADKPEVKAKQVEWGAGVMHTYSEAGDFIIKITMELNTEFVDVLLLQSRNSTGSYYQNNESVFVFSKIGNKFYKYKMFNSDNSAITKYSVAYSFKYLYRSSIKFLKIPSLLRHFLDNNTSNSLSMLGYMHGLKYLELTVDKSLYPVPNDEGSFFTKVSKNQFQYLYSLEKQMLIYQRIQKK